MARVGKAKAVERLQRLVDDASELRPEDGYSKTIQKWLRDVDNSFFRIFGEDSRQYSAIPTSYSITPKGLRNHLNRMASLVESCLDDVRNFWDDDEESPGTDTEGEELSTVGSFEAENKARADRVFIIHGRDEAARETVARFVEKLGLEPVILHEQTSKGRTIIEKFEDHADVGFAIVLLTPDDVGGPRDGKPEPKSRARQNVIFELGFFLGKLGRQRVSALVKGDVETPSDYDGVVYIDLDDAGGWKMKVVRELKAAGFHVDANRVFET